MKTRFQLKSPSQPQSIILLSITGDKKQQRISTKISCSTAQWSQKLQRFRGSSQDSRDLNELLARWESVCSRICRESELEGYGVDRAAERIAEEMGFKTGAVSHSLLMPYYCHWATTSTPFKQASRQDLNCYNTLYRYLGQKAPNFRFDEVTYTFYQNFINYLSNERKLRPNSIGNHIKKLKAVMNASFKEGLHQNTDYLKFVKPTEEVFNIYLTSDEVAAVRNVDLDDCYCAARDFFILGCRTGLRYSDVARLEPSMIRDGLIYIRQKKTGTDIVIPAHDDVITILNRYGSAPSLNESDLNKQLKVICRIAGITDPITYTVRESDGSKRTITKEKCMMVSSHTARRSFATNAYLAGLNTIDIMKFTGHNSERTFLNYIKITNEETAQTLQDNPFFKK